MDDFILQISKLSYAYEHSKKILNNISFDLKRGENLGILGPNGGGKSTLLKIIVGLLEKQSGVIEINGREIHSMSSFPRHLFSYLPQGRELSTVFPIRVCDLLEFGHLTDTAALGPLEVLNIVGMKHKINAQVADLSGGEKQRVFLAKALIKRPKILVLDEPTNGLDSTGQDQLQEILAHIKKETGIIIVDHNINQILKHSDKILCLNNTAHWHNHKELLTKQVLESIYHCEFEHILIHENQSGLSEHHQCSTLPPKQDKS